MGNIVASLCRSFWSPCSVWASGGWTLCRRCRTFSAVTGATPTLPPCGPLCKGQTFRVSVLTPPPYRCSLTAPAGEQRDATIGYYDSCIRLAAELDCHRLVLSAAGACWDLPPQELTEHAAAMLTHLCHTAQVEGVKLLLAPGDGR